MINKNFNSLYAVLITCLAMVGCMEESGFNILWEGLEVEFEGAALPNNAITEVVFQDNQQIDQIDQTQVRINLVGEQIDSPVDIIIGIDTSSTAVQGVHYRMESTAITIPANSSFVDLPIEILTENLDASESPDLVLNIIDAGDVKISANYKSVTLQIRLACPSDLAGTYNTLNVGTGGTLNYQVTITEIEPLTYRISDITGGVYSLVYGAEDNPAIFTDLCNVLTISEQPDVVFGDDVFNGTGRVNPDGTITISWQNENEESGVTTLTKVN
ncbi:MAG: DUF4843 domain-containing protein [Anditalea sp.]